jgi:two-component system sensor histidine kinase RegB
MNAAHRINFSWLIRLRWGALVGQLATILVVEQLLHIDLPFGALALVVGFEALTNVAATLYLRSGRPISEAALALTMALDIAILTALLFFSGGPSNPFSFLYLVHIALAAVVLRSAWTWILVALALACSAGLFYGPVWLRLDMAAAGGHLEHIAGGAGELARRSAIAVGNAPRVPETMHLHLQGMWFAFAVAAGFIVYFVTRVQRALAQREADLAAERAAALRNERLASLATLAAGAAHELATPLGTIAVTARELERQAARGQPAPLEDVRLIRAQIERCRAILDQMAADAGESAGEAPAPTTLGRIVDEALRDLPPAPAVDVDLGALREAPLLAPRRALGQALAVLVRNAQDASPAHGPVRIRAQRDGEGLRLSVSDEGPGMPPEVLAHAGEPFFTTKAPGRGLGLGLFLARTVVEQIGGRLQLDSAPGRGTRAVVALGGTAATRPTAVREAGGP